MALTSQRGLGVAVSGLQLSKGRLVTVFPSQVGGGRRPSGKQPVPSVTEVARVHQRL